MNWSTYSRVREAASSQPVRELSLGERMKMELTAALLHSPEVLFLDEPTIGLDVVAQHNIQNFLRHYQELRKITILLTSHYMKDVAALCKRVVVIANGQHHVRQFAGRHRGPIQRTHKIVTFQFREDEMPSRSGALRRRVRSAIRPKRQTPYRSRRRAARAVAGARRTTTSKTSAWKTRRWKKSSPICFRRPRNTGRMPTADGQPAVDRRSVVCRPPALAGVRHTSAALATSLSDRPNDYGDFSKHHRVERPAARIGVWWTILRTCLVERLVYRADFALGTLMRFLPIVTQIFLWAAIFEANGDQEDRRLRVPRHGGVLPVDDDQPRLLEYAWVWRPGIALEIREGTIKKYLIQPIDLIGFLLLNRIAHKLVYYSVATGAVRAGVLSLPRLFPRLAGRRGRWRPTSRRC